MKYTTEQLQEIIAKCEAAAEGPWFAEEVDEAGLTLIDDGRVDGMFTIKAETFEAQFIAMARTILPQLAQALMEAQNKLQAVEHWAQNVGLKEHEQLTGELAAAKDQCDIIHAKLHAEEQHAADLAKRIAKLEKALMFSEAEKLNAMRGSGMVP